MPQHVWHVASVKREKKREKQRLSKCAYAPTLRLSCQSWSHTSSLLLFLWRQRMAFSYCFPFLPFFLTMNFKDLTLAIAISSFFSGLALHCCITFFADFLFCSLLNFSFRFRSSFLFWRTLVLSTCRLAFFGFFFFTLSVFFVVLKIALLAQITLRAAR